MPIIAVVARKGGVGKTSITANLATEFLEGGYSVRVFDADPQQSLLQVALLGQGLLRPRTYFLEMEDPESFQRTIQTAQKEVDIVLIDTPPAFADPALLAALLADLVLIPCGPALKDVLASNDMLKLMRQAQRERGNQKPSIFFVPNQLNPISDLSNDLPINLKELGAPVLPGIGRRVVIAKADETGLTVLEYDKRSKSRQEFQALTNAIMEQFL